MEDPKVPLCYRRGPTSLRRVQSFIDPDNVEIKRLRDELAVSSAALGAAESVRSRPRYRVADRCSAEVGGRVCVHKQTISRLKERLEVRSRETVEAQQGEMDAKLEMSRCAVLPLLRISLPSQALSLSLSLSLSFSPSVSLFLSLSFFRTLALSFSRTFPSCAVSMPLLHQLASLRSFTGTGGASCRATARMVEYSVAAEKLERTETQLSKATAKIQDLQLELARVVGELQSRQLNARLPPPPSPPPCIVVLQIRRRRVCVGLAVRLKEMLRK
jgi:hypothetical protein